MRLRCGIDAAAAAASSAVLVVVSVVVVTTLVVIEPGALFEVVTEVVGPSAAMIPAVVPALMAPVLSILLEAPIKSLRRGRYRWHGRRMVALVGAWRVGRRRLERAVGLCRIASAHWSSGIARRAAVKAHPDGRTHGLGLGQAVVRTSTPSCGAKLLRRRLVLRRVRGRRRTPLLGWTTWLLLRRIGLAIGGLR